MKVITEERLRELLKEAEKAYDPDQNVIATLIDLELEEIDTLTPKETDLILAAEKYADLYSDDDRQDIKTDVLNAFYHGADYQIKRQSGYESQFTNQRKNK